MAFAMRKRKPSRRRVSARADKQTTVVGVAWYSPAEFVRPRECAADLEIIEETHAEWEDNAIRLLEKLTTVGITAVRVLVIVDEIVRWCAAQDRPFDGAARAAYAAEQLQKQSQSREP